MPERCCSTQLPRIARNRGDHVLFARDLAVPNADLDLDIRIEPAEHGDRHRQARYHQPLARDQRRFELGFLGDDREGGDIAGADILVQHPLDQIVDCRRIEGGDRLEVVVVFQSAGLGVAPAAGFGDIASIRSRGLSAATRVASGTLISGARLTMQR